MRRLNSSKTAKSKSVRAKRLVAGFNLLALLLFLSLLLPLLADGFRPFPTTASAANTGLIASESFRLAGRWAVRLLIVSLAVSPLVHLLGWRGLLPLRKWAGLYAFAFAALHFAYFLGDVAWRKVWGSPFILPGLAALLILSLMALSSNRRAMRWLGRGWKRLHRLVYLAALLVVLHGISGILTWQNLPAADAALLEMQLYTLLIALLLLLRLPALRTALRTQLRLPKRKRAKAKNTA